MANTPDKTVPREIAALLSGERVILRETKRAVTPFGGVAVFIAYLHKVGLVEQIRRHMPIIWKSPNRIDPTDTFVAEKSCPFMLFQAHKRWSPPACGPEVGISYFDGSPPTEVRQVMR